MLGRYGETLVVDWGLAKSVDVSEDFDTETMPPFELGHLKLDQTVPGSPVGSPQYMSPEQASGLINDLGPATDIFGLGAMLFHLLAGEPPIDGTDEIELIENARKGDYPDPLELNPHAPIALCEVCTKAMSKAPENRPANVVEFRDLLQRWIDDEPLSAAKAAVAHFQRLYEETPEREEYRERLGTRTSGTLKESDVGRS